MKRAKLPQNKKGTSENVCWFAAIVIGGLLMNTALPSDLEQFVKQELAAGHYLSESDLLIDAVRRLRDEEANLQRFKTQLQERVDCVERGEGIVVERDAMRGFLDQIMSRVDQEIATEQIRES
jgi:putative addiction module CopG family antidote